MFTVKTYDGEKVLEELVLEGHKQAIVSIYDRLKGSLDLSRLKSIIVPEDYKKELFEIQRKNGHTESLVENNLGQSFAQRVSGKSDDGKTTYSLVIHKAIIFTLISDEITQALQLTLDEEEYESFLHTRQLAINTLYRQFAHIHELALNRTISWIRPNEEKGDLRSQYMIVAKQCWSEYFACRTAASTFSLSAEDCAEVIQTCSDAEEMLHGQRSKYNRRKIDLNDFVSEFHKYTAFILKKIACAHGNLYCLEKSREEVTQAIEEGLEARHVGAIWTEFGQVLSKLYDDYPEWKDDTVFNDICTLIEGYYKKHEIHINETPQGVCYDVPVGL